MNKKINTLLFIAGATLFNIIITVLLIVLLLIVYARFLINILPETAQAWVLMIIFIAAIAASFVIYRYVIKLLEKKIDMTKYFDPIFSGRRGGGR